MIRLAIAVGFLAVFGLVAYSIVLLLTDFFKRKDKARKAKEKNSEDETKTNK
jgi:hypothetical protein